MEVQILTDIANEPVTLAQVRDYLRITTTAEDDTLSMLITSARERLEKYTCLSFGERELKVRWSSLDSIVYGKELPYQPNADVTECKNDSGANISYQLRGLEYKKIYLLGSEGVNVTYTAGFETLPSGLKNALLKEIATEYEQRENFILNANGEPLSNDAKRMCSSFTRNLWLAN
jgi:hypothetical protein